MRRARPGDRRRRLHRLEPRRRPAGARRRGASCVDDLSTGRRENLDGARALARGRHHRRRRGRPRLRADARPEVGLPPRRPGRRAPLGRRPGVRRGASTSAARPSCSTPPARAGARRFVLASTGGAIYGDTDRVPTPEDAPPAPMAPYGACKAAAETYLALYARLHGLPTVALRYANVYGPRQDPLGEGGVVAIFCRAAADGEPAVSSATAVRRATSSTSATWSRRTSRPPSRTSAAPTTSARARRRSSSSWPSVLGVELELLPARAGRGPPQRCLDPARRARRAGLGGASRHGRGPRAHPALGALPLSRARRRRRRVLPARRADPVLGVWAHRQALAARDAGADVRVLVLHRPVPSRARAAQRDAAR